MDDVSYLTELYDQAWQMYISTGIQAYADQADEYMEEITRIFERMLYNDDQIMREMK